jgi:5'-methylthioadenosine phosphorylase
MIVIFGGTAAYHLKVENFAALGERRIIQTPFGDSSPFIQLSTDIGSVWFNSRHGEGGLQRSAAFVNHRANVWAAKELEAEAILSWNGVGAIAAGLSVGQCVVPDDVLDMTRARLSPTFADRATHTTSGSPFNADWRKKLVDSCAKLNFQCATHGVYVCTEGPRLETASEIAMYGWGGAAVVGMTLAPEIWLAAELGIPYASLCVITNMATGRWHFDSRRDFGVSVAEQAIQVMLGVV